MKIKYILWQLAWQQLAVTNCDHWVMPGLTRVKGPTLGSLGAFSFFFSFFLLSLEESHLDEKHDNNSEIQLHFPDFPQDNTPGMVDIQYQPALLKYSIPWHQ